VAEAPGHLLGQIIGNTLEDSVEPLLRKIADEHDLYLDKKCSRPARTGLKVSWTDGLGNVHDLDFVLERAGSDTQRGRPAAFIETAWRRYTKHSRAKAQEIQGALLPLLLHHSDVKPFAGAVVAGRWTDGALQQMRSSGFAVLHVSYEDIVDAFASAGIDIDSSEDTPDEYLKEQVEAYRKLTPGQKREVAKKLISNASDEYMRFATALQEALERKIIKVVVLPLSGSAMEFTSVMEAMLAIQTCDIASGDHSPFVRFEIQLMYSNGDEVSASFAEKDRAIEFVRSFV
jgi:hypothetical protein